LRKPLNDLATQDKEDEFLLKKKAMDTRTPFLYSRFAEDRKKDRATAFEQSSSKAVRCGLHSA
jgi:hypothetical protein